VSLSPSLQGKCLKSTGGPTLGAGACAWAEEKLNATPSNGARMERRVMQSGRLPLVPLEEIRPGAFQSRPFPGVQTADAFFRYFFEDVVDGLGFLHVLQDFEIMFVGEPPGLTILDPISQPYQAVTGSH